MEKKTFYLSNFPPTNCIYPTTWNPSDDPAKSHSSDYKQLSLPSKFKRQHLPLVFY